MLSPDEQTLTMYKLIILYILKYMNGAMTNAQISSFILERGYTDYFTVQEALAELAETGMIELEKKMNVSRCTITQEGLDMLDIFLYKITPAIREDIREFLKEKGADMRQTNSYICDYSKNSKGEYNVTMQAQEDKEPVIELKLSVPDEEMAIKFCKSFKDKSADIYSYVMNALLEES